MTPIKIRQRICHFSSWFLSALFQNIYQMWSFEWQTSFAFRQICFLSFAQMKWMWMWMWYTSDFRFKFNLLHQTSKTNVWYLNALDWSNKWGSSCMRLSTHIVSPSPLSTQVYPFGCGCKWVRAGENATEWVTLFVCLRMCVCVCVLSFVKSLYHVSWILSYLIRKRSRLRKWCVWNKLIRKSHHSQQPFECGGVGG